MSELAPTDTASERVREPVRVRVLFVRVMRTACPGWHPAPNPDTRGTRRVPVSGFFDGGG